VEGVESQKQASPSSHRSLEISHTTRDSHIPTAVARRAGKVENQKQVSHFPIPPCDDEHGFLSPERSGLQPPKPPLRGATNTIAKSQQQVKTQWKGALPRPPAPQVLRIILYWKRKSISGSSFDWNMLGSAYAAAGSLIVFLTWIYYSVQIFLLGAEFTHEYALRHGSHSRPHARKPRRPPAAGAD
jgi:hypothetical protein